ncbi:chymotrypsin-like [Armigeres subalbatus]|uniref:chymotrypsin-like n=1 Tax=Armigeres subalbatus TaxID=124917 RepID=UPI002ED42C84
MKQFTLLVVTVLILGAQATPDRSSRIINGHASPLQPYNVYLLYLNANNAGFYGGGSIISTRHVLTAAQNIFGYIRWDIGMGSNIFSQLSAVTSTDATAHPSYNSANKANDIGIVTLPVALVFSSTIQPIGLPPLTSTASPLPLENEQGFVVGFGFTNAASTSQSATLVRSYPRVTANLRCQQFYAITLPLHFCAENNIELSNICNGDLGAGFITDVRGTPTVTGIASLISASCGNTTPSGYTRVESYRQWIYSITLV